MLCLLFKFKCWGLPLVTGKPSSSGTSWRSSITVDCKSAQPHLAICSFCFFYISLTTNVSRGEILYWTSWSDNQHFYFSFLFRHYYIGVGMELWFVVTVLFFLLTGSESKCDDPSKLPMNSPKNTSQYLCAVAYLASLKQSYYFHRHF